MEYKLVTIKARKADIRRLSFGYNEKQRYSWICLSPTLCDDLGVDVGDSVVFALGDDGQLYLKKGGKDECGIRLHRTGRNKKKTLKGSIRTTFSNCVGKYKTDIPNKDGWVRIINFPASILK